MGGERQYEEWSIQGSEVLQVQCWFAKKQDGVIQLNKSRRVLFCLSIFVMIVLTGCMSGNTDSPTNEAATVKIGLSPTLSSADDQNLYIIEPVKKKYPHITVQPIVLYQEGTNLENLVTTGNIPDIIVDFPYVLSNMRTYELNDNMDALIKKHKFDLGRINSEYLETIKNLMGVDYLTALPLVNNSFALFYNVDLFNRFGIDPPRDNMTWEEIREIAIKMNRTDGGTPYYGLYADHIYRAADQISLPYLDVKNHEAVFQSDLRWKQVFELWLSLYNLPGTDIMPDSMLSDNAYKNGQVAMFSGYSLMLTDLIQSVDFAWDVVTYPTNPLAPGVGQSVDALLMAVTKQSKNKDAAFQVISVMLSDEVQTGFSKNSQVSVLKEQKVQEEFGKATSALASKNVIAFTKNKLAIIPSFAYVPVQSAVTIPIELFLEVRRGEKDINTALREADERMNQLIEAERFKKE